MTALAPRPLYDAVAASGADLAELCIVSSCEVSPCDGDEVSCTVAPAEGGRCPRCWNVRELGEDGLCPRCRAVLSAGAAE